MKTRWMTIIAGLALAAALAPAAAAGEQRPMSGQFTAVAVAAAPRCGANALTLGFEITSTATHLGRLTGSGSNCTEFTLTTEAVEIWDGLATFVAADGSTLTATSEGQQGAPVAGRAEAVTTHTITGGTGRFEGAAGIWTVSSVIDFTTGSITGRVSGWLSY